MISAIGSLVVAVACVIAGWLLPMLIQNVSADLRVALVVGITMGILGTILVVVGQLGKRSLPTNGCFSSGAALGLSAPIVAFRSSTPSSKA